MTIKHLQTGPDRLTSTMKTYDSALIIQPTDLLLIQFCLKSFIFLDFVIFFQFCVVSFPIQALLASEENA